MKLPNRLIPSQLIDISCTAYVKGNTSDHPRERQPLLTHPPPPSPLSSLKIQTLSWKNTHKYNRQRRDALRTDGGTRGAQEENLTSRLNAWMDSVCSTAVAVLDLANHEQDYLLNHWYLSPFSLGSRMVVLRLTFFLSSLRTRLKKTGRKTDERRFKVRGRSHHHIYLGDEQGTPWIRSMN